MPLPQPVRCLKCDTVFDNSTTSCGCDDPSLVPELAPIVWPDPPATRPCIVCGMETRLPDCGLPIPTVESANDRQVGGSHYKDAAGETGEQHWDRVYRMYGRGYFVGCATKYIERYHLKNGKQDLEKAVHFIQKLIELEYGADPAPRTDVTHNTKPKEKK